MKLSPSNTSELNWDSPLSSLVTGNRPSPTLLKLSEAGLRKISDLLWILPLRIHKTPPPLTFREAQINQFFRGAGKVLHTEIRPAFGRRGKGKILLYNGYVVLKDERSSETMGLRWFNLYPNQKKQIENLDHISFLGLVQDYKTQKQIINPQILTSAETSPYIIEYPTVNKLSGTILKKAFELIPTALWNKVPQLLPELGYDKKLSLGESFKIIHGKIPPEQFNPKLKELAEERLIYEEFLIDQLKIQTRRKYIKKKAAPIFEINEKKIDILKGELPFNLTEDQNKVLSDIIKDLSCGHPMMRMIQGDVGCGKTIVAFLTSTIITDNNYQVALMCPTEALAQQHYDSFRNLSPKLSIELLLGSTKSKDKKMILANLKNGSTQMVIGTHSLFQDSVQFKCLALAIIDEQHKFGVEQRLKLISKGEGTHSLIMTATPIPRTLSLAQYGDLDISTIRMMPSGRKGIKTRITEKQNYDKYIEFIRSRLLQREQAYFVFPAIDESEMADLQNVKEGLKKYQNTFRGYKVEMLHGQMKPEDKEKVIQDFRDQKIHILISTSVIEVGINIPNATIMSIYNPERFGLSSLHQLRGRVGRGERPGFCFLVLDKELPPDSYHRMEVIEKNLDGFIIAEEDLKFRGEGDLFGVDQSGSISTKKLANFLTHTVILEQVVMDVEKMIVTHPEILAPIFEKLAKDQKILDTI
jgi:ATP-dependent DNA helicase RecG